MISIFLFVLITCFYAAYFYKQFSLRKSGIATNRLAKGDKPIRTRRIEAALLFATYGTAVVQYVSVFFGKYMLAFSLPLAVRIIGLILAGLAVLFFLFAIFHMKDSWRAGIDESQKTSIVTTGVYRFSRNPAFVGFDLLYIGSILASPNLIMTTMAFFSILLLHLQILEEEKYLSRVFGDEYADYRKKTPRYLLFF